MEAPQLRCVFVTLSPLVSAIVAEALSRSAEFQLLLELDSRNGLAQQLTALSPDVVVVGLQEGEADNVGLSVLTSLARAKVLLIRGGGDVAYLYQMRPYRSVLVDFSPDNLLGAVVGRSPWPKV